ncbi:hypothetical protein [Treponema denticola]|uniref:hypothetical protein n=1 Tax=Treponema denticola TaxID=158 RepID=UPI0020A4BD80|nr:hypothetical protein [Treponema denticola]UTC82726.1 hypothetical protein HGJ18_05710 [Treponema denticola]
MTEKELIEIYKKNLHKQIKVKCTDGNIFEGFCSGFTRAVDNEPEISSIMLDPIKKSKNIYYDILATEIDAIETLN